MQIAHHFLNSRHFQAVKAMMEQRRSSDLQRVGARCKPMAEERDNSLRSRLCAKQRPNPPR